MLPAQQPAHELSCRYWLNLLAKRRNRQVMNTRQQPPIAPFGRFGFAALGLTGEVAAQRGTTGLETKERPCYVSNRHTQQIPKPGSARRPGMHRPTFKHH